MELYIFARFHARMGAAAAVVAELWEAVQRVSVEPGCLTISTFQAVRDPRLFCTRAGSMSRLLMPMPRWP
jgi:quinol monooxygenase YgiN